ncbi:MAG: GNAT family N-acetyltransferase [Pseudobdellovibrio sp.]
MILRELTSRDEQPFLKWVNDWKNESLSWATFAWKPGMSHAEHLQILQDQKDKSKIPAHLVPSTMLYAFVNDDIVGRFNIRHELNDNLLQRGGHIGYAVSPHHRKKGHATEIFRLGMQHCLELGLNRVLITCSDENVPSWKIIEKFHGDLENKVFDQDKAEYIRRYWLDVGSIY